MLFRQLEYFVAVAREGHFARAAEACFVSQPALSAAIAKLESELGVTLINRGHAFEGLTPEGERLVLWARRILAEHDAFKSEVLAVQTGVTGTLRLGIGPTTATPAAVLVEAFCAAHPLARVRLVEHLSGSEIHRQLHEFELDAAIAYLPPSDGDRLVVHPLYQEQYVVISAPELVPVETKQLTWSDVSRLPLALLSPAMRVRQFIDDAFDQQGHTVNPQVEAQSIETLNAHVATGSWASIVPHTLARTLPSSSHVRSIPLIDPVVRADIVLATTTSASVLTRAFTTVATALDLDDALSQSTSG